MSSVMTKQKSFIYGKNEIPQMGCPAIHFGVAGLGLKGMNIAKGIKGEKEMKKIMIDNRNGKLIAFALVAVLLLIGSVGLASAAAAIGTIGGED